MSTPTLIAERVWTCEIHDYPNTHDCDCQFCTQPAITECCAHAKWVDKLDADGNVVMREKTTMDYMGEMWLKAATSQLGQSLFTAPIVFWNESDHIPKVETKP